MQRARVIMIRRRDDEIDKNLIRISSSVICKKCLASDRQSFFLLHNLLLWHADSMLCHHVRNMIICRVHKWTCAREIMSR